MLVSWGRVARVGAAAVVAAWVTFADDASAQIVAKIAGCTMNDPVHENLKLWKAELEARSNGRIKGEVYPGCQLGSIPRMIEGIQLSTIEIFTTPPANAVGVDPRYQVFDAPGLFQNLDHAHKTLTHPKFRDAFIQVGRDKGMIPVSVWVNSGTSYAALMPFRTIGDLQGRKIRVLASKTETELMAKFGATGVPVTFGEVLQALQNRTIDSVRSAMTVMAGQKYFTVAKFVTQVDDSYIPLMTWVSNGFNDKLSPDLRQLVVDIGREIESKMLPINKEFIARAEVSWREGGAEIIKLSASDQAEFYRRGREVGDEFLGKNPALRDMYTLLKETAEVTK